MNPQDAQKVLDDMNSGRITWDDNLRSAANKAVQSATFNFDYAGEATKAYGELGAYYDRIIKESQGDVNKALARLVEDYNRGIRFKKEDAQTTTQNVTRSVQDNALARGIYQKSAFDPSGGYGIADATLAQQTEPINTALSRYQETAGVDLNRQQTDLPEQEKRKEYDLEQQRRKESADITNSRASQAYQKYQSQLF